MPCGKRRENLAREAKTREGVVGRGESERKRDEGRRVGERR